MTVLKPRYDNEQKCYLLAELKDEISFWKNRALKDEKIDHFEGLKSELNAQILTATCIHTECWYIWSEYWSDIFKEFELHILMVMYYFKLLFTSTYTY